METLEVGDKQLSELIEIVANLEARLAPILPEPNIKGAEKPASGGPPHDVGKSPVISRLIEHQYQIGRLHERLTLLLGEVQL